MKLNHRNLLILSLGAALCASPLAYSATDGAQAKGSVERSHARQANALLDRAATHLQQAGPEQALAAFNDRKGGFVDGQHYVFVLDTAGTMLASNGASRALVGLNVMDLKDAAGQPFIREIVEGAKTSDSGQVKYHWLNPADNKVENKTSLYRKVGDQILVVGYYIPRSSAEHAQKMLDEAVSLVKRSGEEAAYQAFNDPQGRFVMNDEYVFVIGLEDGKYRASGASPNLVGVDVREITDAAGTPLFKQMIELAKDKGIGTVDYVWRNPATNAVEKKHTLIRRVDDVLLGVGYYTPK
jgi:cytochrome c